MELLWGAVGVIAWVGWSFTRDKQWQKPILYWFVLVQICLVTAVLMMKSSQASNHSIAFFHDMVNKTHDLYSVRYLNETGYYPRKMNLIDFKDACRSKL